MVRDTRPNTHQEGSPIELEDFIEEFQGLLWRIEYAKSRIEYLNNWEIDSLQGRTRLFLKDPELRSSLILPEDQHFYETFMESVRVRKRVSVVFRIHAPGGVIAWIKLIGTPSEREPRYFFGFMLDVTETVRTALNLEKEHVAEQMALDVAPYPALLVELRDMRVMAVNTAAEDLFGAGRAQFIGTPLQDLFPESESVEFNLALEKVLFEEHWLGKLLLMRRTNGPFLADSQIRLLRYGQQRLLRLALFNVEPAGQNGERAPASPNADGLDQDSYSRQLHDKVANLTEMEDILRVFMEDLPPGVPADAILFSDIYAKKGKVQVYHAGISFSSMRQGETFAYQGTIAENIERYKLDHLIVDDTLESIKAIDWVLFIPKGIRSYFAKAFYSRGTMRAIMILCSTSPSAFSQDLVSYYAALYAAFEAGVSGWRKAHKRPSL